jgi:hypothetical protein
MKVANMILLTLTAVLPIIPPAGAQAPHKQLAPYAQKLVDDTLSKHPDVVIMAMHVTPPGGSDNVIIASNIALHRDGEEQP